MKRFRKIKRHPFLLAIGTSTLIITVIGFMGRNNLYADYRVDLVKVPQLAVVFQGIKEANYPWDIFKKSEMLIVDENDEIVTEGENIENSEAPSTEDEAAKNNTEAEENDTEVVKNENDNLINNGSNNTGENESNDQEADSLQNNGDKKPTTDKNNTQNDITKNDSDNDGKSENQSDNSLEEDRKSDGRPEDNTRNEDNTSGTKDFETVKKSYFKDALFIGDSRTVGLMEYSGLSEPTFYANVGLNIFEIFDKEIAEVNGKKTTLDKALEKQKFSKIYIMLGINELGTGTSETFAKEYEAVIEKIQKLQPDAIIFIEAIMNVSKKKSDGDPIYNNHNIKERNEAIAPLADNKKVFYIDVNEVFIDKSGGIPENYTFDGIHLKAAYYKMWTDFLLKHGVNQ